MKRIALTLGAGSLIVTPAIAGVLYDNGPVNGVNGYSNATTGVFGFRRTLLDDFVVPDGGWTLRDMHWNSVWGTPMQGPLGTGADLSFRSDLSGTPGAVIAIANVTSISEMFTGNLYFDRAEKTHWVTFSDIVLPAGHYWFESAIRGPQNNFWLTADQNFNECWVNYDDLGGFRSGTDQFGVPSDLNFVFGGIPAPGALGLLALAAVTRRERHFRRNTR